MPTVPAAAPAARSGRPRRGAARRKVCFGHSDALVLPVHDLVAGARRSVDIAALQPKPDRRFLAALRSGLNELAASGRPVTVRLIIGQYPPDGVDAAALLSSLTSELRDSPGARLTVSVAAMRSCTAFETCKSFSWPHAKFIAIDGREALIGGHNLWSADYLVDNPVHDLSMLVRGPAATSPSRFADRLWQFVCANLDKKPSVQLASFSSGQTMASGICPASLAPPGAPRAATGGLPILAVGRLGAGITTDFANQSELARDLSSARRATPFGISQQDIGFKFGRSDAIFPESTLDRLIDFIEQRDGQVYIVLSNTGSTGNSGSTYYNDVSLRAFARHLRDMVQKRVDARDPKDTLRDQEGSRSDQRAAVQPRAPGAAALRPRCDLAGRHDHRQPCQALDGRRPRLLYRLRQSLSGEPAGVRLYRRRPQSRRRVARRLLESAVAMVATRRRLGR